jgi:hypothetical protein
MDVAREVMEFYYRKGERGLSLPGRMEVLHARNKREGLYICV